MSVCYSENKRWRKRSKALNIEMSYLENNLMTPYFNGILLGSVAGTGFTYKNMLRF